MEEQDYLQFEAYLDGNLSKDEILTFNEKLKSDAQFKKAFLVYQDITSHLKHQIENEQETADFKANLDVISTQHFNKSEENKISSKPSHRSNFYKYAIAASVVILLGFFVFNQFGDPRYKDYNNFDTISLTVRSSENAVIKKAEQSFNSQNYAEALTAFNIILEDDFSNLEIQYYKGIALVETNQFEEAELLLTKLSNGSSVYKNKAKWILALNYLKQDHKSACVEVLQTIPKDAEDYNKAQKLLNKLN